MCINIEEYVLFCLLHVSATLVAILGEITKDILQKYFEPVHKYKIFCSKFCNISFVMCLPEDGHKCG